MKIGDQEKFILDACCGAKGMWFNKTDPRALFVDIRELPLGGLQFEIKPDLISDFRCLPFPDRSFKLIAWDPPHLKNLSPSGWVYKKYGTLDGMTWKKDLQDGFNELWRVLDIGGTLVFKWSRPTSDNRSISITEVLQLFDEKPLFGTRSRKATTYWIIFFKSQLGPWRPDTPAGSQETSETVVGPESGPRKTDLINNSGDRQGPRTEEALL